MFSRRSGFWLLAATAVVALSMPRIAMAADAGGHVIGDPGAPVEVVEYASVTCPHCASFHTETLPELKERYIDGGDVKIVTRDFILNWLDAAAISITRCLPESQQPAFMDTLFTQQPNWARASTTDGAMQDLQASGIAPALVAQGFDPGAVAANAGPIQALVNYTALAGMQPAGLAQCLQDGDGVEALLQETFAAREQFGINSTPSFVIDGETYAGNRSIEEWAEILDPLVAANS